MSQPGRREELERKKAKLLAIREEKRKKEEERKKKGVSELEEARTSSLSPRFPDKREEAEKLLQELGISPAATKSDKPPSKDENEGRSKEHDAPPVATSVSAKTINLSMSKPSIQSIAAKEIISYTKETQTPAENTSVGSVLTYDEDQIDTESMGSVPSTPPVQTGRTGSKSHVGMPHVEHVKPAESATAAIPAKEQTPKPPELTEDEKSVMLNSEGFQRFFESSSRVMERALADQYAVPDFLMDYARTDADDKDGDIGGAQVQACRTFQDERWSKGRCIMAMDWSQQYPELLVTAYNQNEAVPHDPDGIVLIWNNKFKKQTPEYIFHSQSAVTSACFARFHPNLVVGGTYSGQVCLWDNRSNKRIPVQRSPLSAVAHTHPVYCVTVVGSQNAHNLVTISTDGKLCTWSLDMLSKPQDSLDLQQQKQSKSVACTCLSFPLGGVNNFVVGSEDGSVYSACRHGSKAGILDVFEGHCGPVTGIDCNAVQGQIDFSHLFVTSSMDWTLKLWSLKEGRALHSMEDNADYVMDVEWSPVNPSTFASVDISGRLDIWNLNTDVKVPAVSVQAENGGVAMSKVRWSLNGQQVAVGDDGGKVRIFDVREQLAVPRSDEWSRLVHTLQDLKEESTELKLDCSSANSSSSNKAGFSASSSPNR